MAFSQYTANCHSCVKRKLTADSYILSQHCIVLGSHAATDYTKLRFAMPEHVGKLQYEAAPGLRCWQSHSCPACGQHTAQTAQCGNDNHAAACSLSGGRCLPVGGWLLVPACCLHGSCRHRPLKKINDKQKRTKENFSERVFCNKIVSAITNLASA